ncbi:MAG: diphthamide biosynthesis enzyme Dph2 [Candidatus Methanoplasma sp.]|jgi:2-(3-amino-3-carboxypropyl)histidine synthase|nr:diphthamide biosynthesis enzyme Dph2 [Candidatus Methanoplasma sp.]
MFDLETGRINDWIRDGGFDSVALQFPEGLKLRALEMSDFISNNTGAKAVILGHPCYGACDVFSDYRRYATALIHFGHSPIPSLGKDENVLFIEVKASPDIADAVRRAASTLPRKVGILATVQYVGLIGDARKILEEEGKTVHVGIGDPRIFHPGQVLGCNFSAASAVEGEAEAFLFLGEGDFHPLAAAFGSDKKVIVLNPMTGEARSVDDIRDRLLRRRFAAIESSKNAERFLIIVCGKVGQNRSSAADDLTEKLTERGKKTYRVVLDEITPDALLHYDADVYVSTACPRIAMDDSARYKRPMLTIPEAEIAAGIRAWDEYEFDSI